MRGISAAAVVFALLLAASSAFGQAGNGQVFGSVQDMSKALMPGVTITLTNKDTNVTDTRVSNDSGAYTFPSVPPGTYKITAELPGFKVSAADNLEVGASGRAGTFQWKSARFPIKSKSALPPIS